MVFRRTFSLIVLLVVSGLALVLIQSFNAILQLAGVHISSGKVAKTAMMVNSMGGRMLENLPYIRRV